MKLLFLSAIGKYINNSLNQPDFYFNIFFDNFEESLTFKKISLENLFDFIFFIPNNQMGQCASSKKGQLVRRFRNHHVRDDCFSRLQPGGAEPVLLPD